MILTEEQIARLPIRNEKVKQKFIAWISNHPESFHPYDRKRWDELVLASLENDEELSLWKIEDEIHLNLGDLPLETGNSNLPLIDYFMDLYHAMKSLFELMKENGYKKA